MNTKIIRSIFVKNIKGLFRDKTRFFFTIFFPILIMVIFMLAFGGDNSTKYSIAVINQDASADSDSWAQKFIGNLTASEILDVAIYNSEDKAIEDLVQGKISGYIVVPENFSQSMADFWNKTPANWTNSTLEIAIDPSSIFGRQALEPLVNQILLKTLFGTDESYKIDLPIYINVNSGAVEETVDFRGSMISGMVVYSVFINIMSFSEVLVQDREKGIIKRYKLSKTTSADILMGETSGAFVISSFQAILVVLTGILMGFQPLGGLYGLFFSVIIAILFSLFPIGLGILIGMKMKTAGSTTSVSLSILMILSYFSGLFIPLEIMPEALQAFAKILPPTYANDAIKSLIARGASVLAPQILMDILILVLAGILIYMIAWILFKKEYN
ncbi:MAG: ABC transporter permease [Promethearchaeota archaeon]